MALMKRAEQITQQNRNRFVITRSRRGASGSGIPTSNYYYRYPNNIYNQPTIYIQPRPAPYNQVPERNVPYVVYLEDDHQVDDDTSDCSMTIPLIPGTGAVRDVGSLEKKSSASPTGVADLAPPKPKKGKSRRRCGGRRRRKKDQQEAITTTRRMNRHSPPALSALNENVETYADPVSNTSATEKLASLTKSATSTMPDNSVLPSSALDEISTQAMPEIQEHEDEDNDKPSGSRNENDVNNSPPFFVNPLSYMFGSNKPEKKSGDRWRDGNRHSTIDRKTSQTIPTEQDHVDNDDDVSSISAETSYQVSFGDTRSSVIVDLKLRKRKMERDFSRKAHQIPPVVVVDASPPEKPMSPM